MSAPTVRPGQVWRENDPRAEGRRVLVERIADGFAYVYNEAKGSRSRVHLQALPKRFTLVGAGASEAMRATAREEVVSAAVARRAFVLTYGTHSPELNVALDAAVDALTALEEKP